MGAEGVEHLGVHEVLRRRPAGRGDHEKVAPRGERGHAREPRVGRVGALRARVVADRHVEPGRAARDLGADRTEADKPQALARDVRLHRQRGAPDAGTARAVELRHGAHAGQQQCHRMVGHAVVVGAGAVGDDDAARARMRHVDVFKAGTEHADQLELRHRVDLGGGEADRADRQHRPERGAVRGDRRGAAGVVGRIGGGEVRGDRVERARRHRVQDQQRRLHANHSRATHERGRCFTCTAVLPTKERTRACRSRPC